MLFNRRNLLLAGSCILFFIYCSSSSKQKKINDVNKTEYQKNPSPVVEPQTDSLKKVLDEKRKNRKPD